MSTMSAAKEIVKGGVKKYGKTLVTNAEKFIAGKIANSKWLPLDWKKQVLGPEGKLSLKDTTGEAFTKKMDKRTKAKGALENQIKGGVKVAVLGTEAVVAGPKFNNAFQAALGDSKSIFSGPDSPTMAQLRTKTLKKLKERKDNNIKKAIASALKEVKGVPQKRPTPVRKAASKKYVTGLPDSYKKYKGGMAKKKK